MSKMRVPKMDVVRFKESDVIVASGGLPNFIKVAGFNDNISGNGTIEYNGVTYDKTNYSVLIDFLTAQTDYDSNVKYQSMSQTINKLFARHDGTNAGGYVDGTYVWDASDNAFKQ